MRRLLTFVILAALLGLSAQECSAVPDVGGVAIANSVSATYSDAAGNGYSTTSNVVTVDIAKIAAITVTPKEAQANPATDGAPANAQVTRAFVISNTSNIPDAYKIIADSAAPLRIVSMSYVTATGPLPVTQNVTVSPTVQPGGSIVLDVVIDTTGLAVGASVPVTITAQTTATADNGLQSDSGKQWLVGATGPSIVGPGGNGTQITKLVDQVTTVQTSPGGTVTYEIQAKNVGGMPAANVVVTDDVPAGLTAQLSTVTIGGTPAGSAATLNGQTLTVHCGTLNAGASLIVTFQATTPNLQALGSSYVNVAQLSADGIPPQQTTPASVLIGTANIVFDGYGGASHAIAGATVTLLDSSGHIVNLTGNGTQSVERHALSGVMQGGTANPMVTAAGGAYGFALQANQIAPGGSQFTLRVTAPGYLNRKIGLTITPSATGTLYDVKATSEDGQPIAQAGGFDLTKSSVDLSNVFGLFGNIPMFNTRTIVVTKTADRSTAQPGDRIKYTIAFSNTTQFPIGSAQIVDVMPPGLVYAKGTAQFDGTPVEPSISGSTLTWVLAQLQPGVDHTITYYAIVYPTAAPGTNLTNNVTVGGNIPGTHLTATGGSSVTVQVIAGALTQRRPITGRVFLDIDGTGHFKKGDKGVAGVRVFMEDGTYVVTDPEGRFDFPNARPGMHVLRIDPTTLPKGVQPYPDQRMNSTRALQQLVHDIMDVGILDDVEFALQP